MKENMYRHGDLMIKTINSIPTKATLNKNNTLALGEVTGHSHRLNSKQLMVYEDLKQTKYLNIKQDTELIHEEHDTLILVPGKYVVLQEQEFDPIQDEIRQVMD